MKLNILSLLVSLITIAGASLPQRCFADLAGDFVHRHKQNQVDDIVEQAHGGRQAVLGAFDAQLVNISGDDLRHRSVAVCLHEQHFSKERFMMPPTAMISMMTMVGIMAGRLMWMIRCSRVAPSMVAASCRSGETPACSAAM